MERNIATLGIYQAIDPLNSGSKTLMYNSAGIEHYGVAVEVKKTSKI